jgi:hypothetical protein
MTDLAVLVPSRGRPANVARLVDRWAETCRADTILHFGFDEDDPAFVDNLDAAEGCLTSIRPRMGLAAWTNELASLHMDSTHLASIGDDMVPVTPGWDEKLIGACGPGGMSYPCDKRRDDIPEAVVMSTRIVAALGWMCLPSLHHWYVDNVWSDLGRGAGCLTYLPEVVVEHRHPNVRGGDKPDPTYWDAAPLMGADLAAYQRWRLHQMRADIDRVVRACSGR